MAQRDEDVLDAEIRECVCDCAKESGLVGDITLDARPLTSSGDNYLGVVYGVKAEGTDSDGNPKAISFALKRMHKDEAAKESLQATSIFATEVHFYSKVLPAFKDLQEKYGPKSEEDLLDFIPRCYKCKSDGIGDFILLEDLGVDGFSMGDRKRGLNREECMLVMRSLGRFHAFSYAMIEKDPQTFRNLTKKLIDHPFFKPEKRERYSDIFQKVALCAVDGVRLHSPEAAKKLEAWVSKGYFDAITEFYSMKDGLSVIAHDDTWTNNVMFRGNPSEDLRLLDYQLMIYHSPATDVMYTLYTSVLKQVRDAYFEEFLQEYHTALTKSLCHLGSNPDVLSMNVFKEHIKRYGMLSLSMALFLVPIFYGEETDEINFSNEGDAIVRQVSNHSIYMKDRRIQMMMVGLVEEFVERGYFNA